MMIQARETIAHTDLGHAERTETMSSPSPAHWEVVAGDVELNRYSSERAG